MNDRLALILWRKNARYSVQQAASVIGVKPRTVRSWEYGQRRPSDNIRQRLREIGIQIGQGDGQ